MRGQRKSNPDIASLIRATLAPLSRHCEEQKRRSNPALANLHDGLLRGTCHRAAFRADPLARNDGFKTLSVLRMGERSATPSFAVFDSDGFRNGFNPSYALE